MKKTYLIFALGIFFCLNISAQSHEWQWAKTAVQPNNNTTGAGVRSVSTDDLGNAIATGYFYSDSLTFGAYTIHNAGIAGYTENIFTVKYDPSGNVLWAKSGGGALFDFPEGVKADHSGNIYISGGFFSDSISFDGHVLYNYGPTDTTCDGFVVKYDANGNFVWGRSFGGDYYDGSDALTTDPWGNVYVTGYYQSDSITIGTYTLYNSTGSYHDHNALLIKYDSLGNVIWVRNSYNGGGGVEAYAVCADPAGNVMLAGRYTGPSVTFGPQTVQNQTPAWNDIFIVKYDSSGIALWAQEGGGNENDYAYAVAADAQGNSYITGAFYSSSAAFGSQQLNNDTNDVTGDIFLAKYDPNGTLQWVKAIGGDQNDVACGVTTDSASNVYITGYYLSPSLIFGSDTLVNFDNTGATDDVFVATFDPNGNPTASVEAGGLSFDGGYAITSDLSNNIYVGGFFRSDDIVFGSSTLNNSTPTHTLNPFVAKYINISTGISIIDQKSVITLYPNPANDMIVAESPSFSSGGVTVAVYDVTGTIMAVGETFAGSKIVLNTSGLSAGMYIVKFVAQGEETKAKFIKVNSVQ